MLSSQKSQMREDVIKKKKSRGHNKYSKSQSSARNSDAVVVQKVIAQANAKKFLCKARGVSLMS